MVPTSPWFSPNPERARAELFFLCYTPVWVAAVAVAMFSGVLAAWKDMALFTFTGVLLVPMVAGSIWFARVDGRPLWDNYATKFNIWVWILVWAGSYFYSHYFFELMGMHYGFLSEWHLEAELMGSKDNEVPIFLYPLTHIYFLTYHTVMVMCLRRARHAFGQRRWLTIPMVLFLAYAQAFAETYFMAIEEMTPYFHYGDRHEMLKFGSTMFAMIFVVSLPMVYRLEETPGAHWTYGRVAIDALAASMISLMLLDAWAMFASSLVQ